MKRLKPALPALRAPVGVPALIAALALLARFIPGPRTIDDAFITFRYARNILAGQGFVYNSGEAVLGTTTPLYTLLMAGLGALTGGAAAPFPLLALLVNALADVAVCLLLWSLGRRLGFERAGIMASLAWAVAPFSVTFAIGGLETSLYVALLTGALTAAVFAGQSFSTPGGYGREEPTHDSSLKEGQSTLLGFLATYVAKKPLVGGGRSEAKVKLRILAALLASLALLTRPDALILLAPLVLERLWSAWVKKETLHWGEFAAALLPYGAWAVFAALTFGSPLPHSVLAKAAAYRLEAGEGLIRLLQHYATPFLEQNLWGSGLAVGLGLLLYPFLFLLALRRAWRTRPRPPLALWAWALYPWLYLVTFAIPNPLIFRWYLTPPLPAYFFFIFIGMEGLLEGLTAFLSRALRRKVAPPVTHQSEDEGNSPTTLARQGESTFLGFLATDVAQNPLKTAPPPKERGVGGGGLRIYPSLKRQSGWISLLLLLPVVVSLADWRLTPDHGPDRPAPAMAYIQLELLYRQAAERIASQLTLQSVLAAGDVGVLGYDTPAHILDTVGLNSPVSTTYYPLPANQYVINYAIPSALLLDQRPDWIVVLEVYGRRTFLPDPRFQAAYVLEHKIDTNMYGSDGLLIFRKR